MGDDPTLDGALERDDVTPRDGDDVIPLDVVALRDDEIPLDDGDPLKDDGPLEDDPPLKDEGLPLNEEPLLEEIEPPPTDEPREEEKLLARTTPRDTLLSASLTAGSAMMAPRNATTVRRDEQSSMDLVPRVGPLVPPSGLQRCRSDESIARRLQRHEGRPHGNR